MTIKKGIFAVYKPKGPTSHDIVAKIKRMAGGEKVGHAGTLDPLARGILVIGVGSEYTKQLKSVVEAEKEYIADIALDAYTKTGDDEGEKIPVEIGDDTGGGNNDGKIPTETQVREAAAKFVGTIQQDQPIFSAVKAGGKRAHRMAREGKEINLGKRTVGIHAIEVLEYSWPRLSIKVICGPGTYIRVLARDVGKLLKAGGYLFDLERTRVGQYTKDEAINLE